MNRIRFFSFLIAGLFLSALLFAQDPVQVAPESYKTKFENEKVRVCEVNLKVGGKIPTHSHPANIHYFSKAGKLKITSADGKSQIVDLKGGEVFWFDPLTHSAENVGTSDIHAIVVELKDQSAK